MPELPEVEVTRRQLSPSLVGRRLSQVQTTRPSQFFLTPPLRLRRRLRGRQFVALVRQGKYLLALLDDGASLLLHLGMTGQLLVGGCQSPRLLRAGDRALTLAQAFSPDLHTHLQLYFEDRGPSVLFRDIRKFGRVKLIEPGQTEARLDRLGVDALQATGDLLWELGRGRRVAVKSFLLDQAVVAGVGNIYADEALFRAGIGPTRPAGTLSRLECASLAEALSAVLLRGIETGGSSVDDFVAPDGSDGGFQDEHQVYQRTGEPCSRCGKPLRRVVVGGRSSHYCTRCQR